VRRRPLPPRLPFGVNPSSPPPRRSRAPPNRHPSPWHTPGTPSSRASLRSSPLRPSAHHSLGLRLHLPGSSPPGKGPSLPTAPLHTRRTSTHLCTHLRLRSTTFRWGLPVVHRACRAPLCWWRAPVYLRPTRARWRQLARSSGLRMESVVTFANNQEWVSLPSPKQGQWQRRGWETQRWRSQGEWGLPGAPSSMAPGVCFFPCLSKPEAHQHPLTAPAPVVEGVAPVAATLGGSDAAAQAASAGLPAVGQHSARGASMVPQARSTRRGVCRGRGVCVRAREGSCLGRASAPRGLPDGAPEGAPRGAPGPAPGARRGRQQRGSSTPQGLRPPGNLREGGAEGYPLARPRDRGRTAGSHGGGGGGWGGRGTQRWA